MRDCSLMIDGHGTIYVDFITIAGIMKTKEGSK